MWRERALKKARVNRCCCVVAVALLVLLCTISQFPIHAKSPATKAHQRVTRQIEIDFHRLFIKSTWHELSKLSLQGHTVIKNSNRTVFEHKLILILHEQTVF
jgi:hypothetical protein